VHCPFTPVGNSAFCSIHQPDSEKNKISYNRQEEKQWDSDNDDYVSDEYEYREPLSTGITTSSSKFVPPPIEEDNFSPDEDTTEYPHEILPPLPKCNTSKIERKKGARSAGIMAAVYNCGVIFGLKEIYGYESIKQVYSFMCDLIYERPYIPMVIAFDNACHFSRFAQNTSKHV
ncbi:unnamed protein product, partial [Didymodactylos carnosus]